jgi:hypothetical protein
MVGEAKPEHPLIPRRPPSNRRQLLMQALVAVVILVSGIGIGTGGTILALKNRLVPRLRLPPPGPPGMEPNVLVERWKGDYSLSEKQAKQAKDTLTKQFAATRELWQKFATAEQSEREKFAGAMKKILTPDQFAKWDSELKRRAEHFRGMRPFDGRGGGRGGPRGERRPDRSMDPNDHRRDGQPRPPMDPNNRHKDRPADRPIKLNSRPADVNAPK